MDTGLPMRHCREVRAGSLSLFWAKPFIFEGEPLKIWIIATALPAIAFPAFAKDFTLYRCTKLMSDTVMISELSGQEFRITPNSNFFPDNCGSVTWYSPELLSFPHGVTGQVDRNANIFLRSGNEVMMCKPDW
ncbi:hypothetical protein [Reyranella sp.]|uniref:hypothetical protein n=1 Tax=Reyranella sp. TaxID=1929291 RepID=UPI003D0F317B